MSELNLPWILVAMWVVVALSSASELATDPQIRRLMVQVGALRAHALKSLRQYSLERIGVSPWAILNGGTDRDVHHIPTIDLWWRQRLGVPAHQKPKKVRRDPRAEPGGNLTDPLLTTLSG